jgi:hypothetical protein
MRVGLVRRCAQSAQGRRSGAGHGRAHGAALTVATVTYQCRGVNVTATTAAATVRVHSTTAATVAASGCTLISATTSSSKSTLHVARGGCRPTNELVRAATANHVATGNAGREKCARALWIARMGKGKKMPAEEMEQVSEDSVSQTRAENAKSREITGARRPRRFVWTSPLVVWASESPVQGV